MELLIGCGNNWRKGVFAPGMPQDWTDLVTLDMDASCKPQVIHDLTNLPLPFKDDYFDEIHAYHVLEHTGAQGDFKFFFAQWSDFWRMLKPDGVFCGQVPALHSEWVLGDPGHTRVIPACIFTFLDQTEYTKQVGKTPLADYRSWYKADFQPVGFEHSADTFSFVLKAIKPSRISV